LAVGCDYFVHVHSTGDSKSLINPWDQVHSTIKDFDFAVRKLSCSRASTVDRACANFDQRGRGFAGPPWASAGATFIIRSKIPIDSFVEIVV
jgi:hypothetical protein